MDLTERDENEPLTKKLAAHLLRRSSFRFTKEKVDELTGMSAADAVDILFDQPSPPLDIERPVDHLNINSPSKVIDWIPLDEDLYSQESIRREYVATWWFNNAFSDHTARHKTAFFLHTTFTTGFDGVSLPFPHHVSSYLFDHLRLLNWLCQAQDLDDPDYEIVSLKKVAKKITLDNLMLGYLNNTANTKYDLNENFAREFLELFTIGRGEQEIEGEYTNYTEVDVNMAAKIFSGFTLHPDGRNSGNIDSETGIPRGIGDPALHTTGPKQFSEKFNSQIIDKADMFDELDEFIEMVFAQRATAENFAKKIYRFYVSTEEDEEDQTDGVVGQLIAALANDLEANKYDFISTIKKLLKSIHFYSQCAYDSGGGNIIKSPIELLAEAMNFFNAEMPAIYEQPTVEDAKNHYFFFGSFLISHMGKNAGMKLFSPNSVAGYPAYYQEPRLDKNWYSPGTLRARFDIAERLIVWNADLHTEIDTVAYLEQLALLDEDQDGTSDIDVSDANEVIHQLVDYLFPQEPTLARFNIIKTQFIGGTSQQHESHWTSIWSTYISNNSDANKLIVKSHSDALVKAVLTAHEFQLK